MLNENKLLQIEKYEQSSKNYINILLAYTNIFKILFLKF